MQASNSIEQRVIRGLAASFLTLLALIFIFQHSIQKLSSTGEWVSYSSNIISKPEIDSTLFTDTMTTRHACLLTADNRFLNEWRSDLNF